MTHRSPRALTRRLALALSVMLLAGALAVPAIADDASTPDAGIIAPEGGDVFAIGEQLQLAANSGDEADEAVVNWAVRLEDPNRNSQQTQAGNVDGFNDDFTLEAGSFTASVDTKDWEASDKYFFVFNWGNPNDNSTREVVQFELVDAFEGFEEDEVEECEAEGDCTITQGNFTASTDIRGKGGGSAFLGLRVTDTGSEGEAVAAAVSEACDEKLGEVNPAARLGPDVVQLLPINFAHGSITVQSTIPRDFVNETTARGAGIFQVCVAAEADQYGGYGGSDEDRLPEIQGTDLFGPIILDRCDEYSTDDDACILDKTKNRGDVVLTYQLPTEDPWLK